METCSRQASAACAAADCIAAHDRPISGTARWFRRGLVLGAVVGGMWLAGASAHAAGAESAHQSTQRARGATVHPAPLRVVHTPAGKAAALPRKVTVASRRITASLAKSPAPAQRRTPGAVGSPQNEVGTTLGDIGTTVGDIGTTVGHVGRTVRAVLQPVRQVVGDVPAPLLLAAIETLPAPSDSSEAAGHDAVTSMRGASAAAASEIAASPAAQPIEGDLKQPARPTSQRPFRCPDASNVDTVPAPKRGRPVQPPARPRGGDDDPLTGSSTASQHDGPSLSVLRPELLPSKHDGATLKPTSPDPRPPHEWASSPSTSPD